MGSWCLSQHEAQKQRIPRLETKLDIIPGSLRTACLGLISTEPTQSPEIAVRIVKSPFVWESLRKIKKHTSFANSPFRRGKRSNHESKQKKQNTEESFRKLVIRFQLSLKASLV
jgi:hypothetical protein